MSKATFSLFFLLPLPAYQKYIESSLRDKTPPVYSGVSEMN